MQKRYLSFLIIGLFGFQAASAQTDNHLATQQLDTVKVKGKAQRATSQATDGDLRDRVNLGLLGKQNAFTTPITVVNYDEKAFADKSPRNLVDVISQTDASVMAFGGESNTLQGLYVRGLQLDARQMSLNGLSGMYSYQSSPMSAVGAAQLIKGASSALGGMDPEGAVSGAVNIETKKATSQPINKLGVAWFGDSRVQGTADFGRRFGANDEWGVRFNTTLRHGDTPRKGYGEDNKEFALNADYRGQGLRVAFDSLYSKRKTTGGRARLQDIQNWAFRLPEAPKGNVNLVPSWQKQTSRDQTNMLTFEYDAPLDITLSGGIGYNQSRYSGNFAQLRMINDKGDYWVGGNATQGSRLSQQTAKTLSMNLSARGFAQTGAVSHNWNVAYDRVNRRRENYWGSAYTRGIRTNIYAPEWGDAPASLAGLSTTPSVKASYTTNSLALSDTLGFDNEKYRLTLGGRMQWVAQEDQSQTPSQTAKNQRFSPMLMAAWLPNPHFMVYGNYMEDLEPGAVDSDTGSMAKPRVSRQAELGVRKNWGNVLTSFNVFQISRPAYWRSAGVYQGVAHKAQEQHGKERNRGAEFNINANLLNGSLRPSLGVMYLKADLRDFPTYANRLVDGVQVSSPRVIAKAGVEWDTPFAPNLTLQAAVQHYGKSYQDSQKQYAFPAYTLVDVGAKYTVKLPKNQTLTLRGSVENVFNQNYWQVQRGQYDRSFAVVGMPRTAWLKADYSF